MSDVKDVGRLTPDGRSPLPVAISRGAGNKPSLRFQFIPTDNYT